MNFAWSFDTLIEKMIGGWKEKVAMKLLLNMKEKVKIKRKVNKI